MNRGGYTVSTRREVVEAFHADDPDLASAEKETVFRFARDQDTISFYTAEAAIGRRLLAHPESEIDGVTIVDGDARPEVDLEDVEEDDHVVGVRGQLPIGALIIKSDSRKSDSHAAVVSERTLDEVRA